MLSISYSNLHVLTHVFMLPGSHVDGDIQCTEGECSLQDSTLQSIWQQVDCHRGYVYDIEAVNKVIAAYEDASAASFVTLKQTKGFGSSCK